MKAIEFRTQINNDQIQLPANVQSQLRGTGDKKVRVMILLDDADSDDEEETTFKKTAQKQFIQGYADSDSVYDKYL